jgi:uncharacterized protein (TIGR01777 family)
MNFLIAGGTGFIGKHLVNSLPEEHKITVIGRSKERIKKMFSPNVQAHSWDELPNLDCNFYDVIINLSGYNIAASRWTPRIKNEIIYSRLHTNTMLIDWVLQQQCRPRFYCANAIGIYGLQENGDPEAFDENSPIDFDHPHDFLQEVGVQWEKSLAPAIENGIPVTITRFGVVLKRGEGFLKKIYPSFKIGLGSIIGGGEQVISWVYLEDLLLAFRFLLMHQEITGPINITSPHPVSQAEFAHVFAKSLHRPLFLRTPRFIIKLLFGEMGECLINRGTRVVPKRLQEEGFKFSYANLEDALAREFSPVALA